MFVVIMAHKTQIYIILGRPNVKCVKLQKKPLTGKLFGEFLQHFFSEINTYVRNLGNSHLRHKLMRLKQKCCRIHALVRFHEFYDFMGFCLANVQEIEMCRLSKCKHAKIAFKDWKDVTCLTLKISLGYKKLNKYYFVKLYTIIGHVPARMHLFILQKLKKDPSPILILLILRNKQS